MELAVDQSPGTAPEVVCLPMFGTTRAATAAAFGPALAGAGLRHTWTYPATATAPRTAHQRPWRCWTPCAGRARPPRRRAGPVAGGSYGAYLATGIARRRPELVRGLLLVCPGITIARDSRDLPDDPPSEAPEGWLDEAPDALHAHLDAALGNRTSTVVATVLAALNSGGPGDATFQERAADRARLRVARRKRRRRLRRPGHGDHRPTGQDRRVRRPVPRHAPLSARHLHRDRRGGALPAVRTTRVAAVTHPGLAAPYAWHPSGLTQRRQGSASPLAYFVSPARTRATQRATLRSDAGRWPERGTRCGSAAFDAYPVRARGMGDLNASRQIDGHVFSV